MSVETTKLVPHTTDTDESHTENEKRDAYPVHDRKPNCPGGVLTGGEGGGKGGGAAIAASNNGNTGGQYGGGGSGAAVTGIGGAKVGGVGGPGVIIVVEMR